MDLECESDGDDSVNPAIMKQYYTQYNATTSSVNTDIYYEDSFQVDSGVDVFRHDDYDAS